MSEPFVPLRSGGAPRTIGAVIRGAHLDRDGLVYVSPSDRAAPADARRALRALRGSVDEQTMAVLELLVTELVTNSIKHADPGAGHIWVRAQRSEGTIRIEVVDPGSGQPFASPVVDGLRESGYGLLLVDRLADRWGVELDGHTVVWVEIDA